MQGRASEFRLRKSTYGIVSRVVSVSLDYRDGYSCGSDFALFERSDIFSFYFPIKIGLVQWNGSSFLVHEPAVG